MTRAGCLAAILIGLVLSSPIIIWLWIVIVDIVSKS